MFCLWLGCDLNVNSVMSAFDRNRFGRERISDFVQHLNEWTTRQQTFLSFSQAEAEAEVADEVVGRHLEEALVLVTHQAHNGRQWGIF